MATATKNGQRKKADNSESRKKAVWYQTEK